MPRKTTSRKVPASAPLTPFPFPSRAGRLRLVLLPSVPRLGVMASLTSASTAPDDALPPLAEWRLVHDPWSRVSNGEGQSFWGFLEAVRRLPRNSLFRHNFAGDLPGDGKAIDTTLFVGLLAAASHLRGFTFTRKPVLVPAEGNEEDNPGLPARGSVVYDEWRLREANREPVRLSNEDSYFTTNLVADSLDEADRLAELGIGPVVVMVDQIQNRIRSRRGGGPADGDAEPQTAREEGSDRERQLLPTAGEPARLERSESGRSLLICPAELGEGTCATCGLCALRQREEIIVFRKRPLLAPVASMRQLTFGGES